MHLSMSIRREVGALPPTLLAPFNSTPRLVTIFVLVILFVLFRYSGSSEEPSSLQDGGHLGEREITGRSILGGSDGYVDTTRKGISPGLDPIKGIDVKGQDAASDERVRGRGEKRPTLDFLIPEKVGSKNAKPKDESPLLEIEKKLGLR